MDGRLQLEKVRYFLCGNFMGMWQFCGGIFCKDVVSNVGYVMGEPMTKNLVSRSRFRAVAAKRPAAGLIHHSDSGSAVQRRRLPKTL